MTRRAAIAAAPDAGRATTWPSAPQRRALALAAVKPDLPSEAALRAAASALLCDLRAIKAVARVEAGTEGAFLATGEPPILFERHKFHRHTGGRFDDRRVPGLPASYSLLSSPKPGGYGPIRVQHAKLDAAVKLDRPGALKSASFGLFQILGENHERAGFPDDPGKPGSGLQRFVSAMYRGADDQLAAFVAFILADRRLVRAIRTQDWVTFARIYNGPAHARNRYAPKLAAAFAAA